MSPNEAETLEWLGTSYKTILKPEDSGGAISIVDSTSPPQSGPPRHIHHAEDETFVILTGECRVWMEGKERTLQAGRSVFIPRGTEHTFKVGGSEPCRHLVILTPGGFEGFFADMAAGAFAIPDHMPQIEDSAKRHKMSFTGPPLD
ncbi:cupin domain-containing protein [Roseobacter sp. HKCCA0434]|uniref:cupin domain-containing protein n=1 Tax=Roseobacter sp. HKCCA0434 TaxID=3079297 RepID=UPI0029059EDC|nr:cupin domain-containing protein [Roseobacter sp. HKCCA0434]